MWRGSNRVAIVTGGNGGIGLGIAQALAEAGASLVIGARNVAKTEDDPCFALK
jgi:2-deoxy-D-gluconate 3-dehydrogenase